RARRFRQWRQRPVVYNYTLNASGRHFNLSCPELPVGQPYLYVVQSRLQGEFTIIGGCFAVGLTIDYYQEATRISKNLDYTIVRFFRFGEDVGARMSRTKWQRKQNSEYKP